MARDVLTALNSKRMLDDILVVHASDNGGVRSFGSKNGGQQGRTRSFLEGGVRVPAFISGSVVSSSHNLKGTSYDGSMHVTDLFATIVGIAERREAFYTKKLNGDFLGDFVPLGVSGVVMGAPSPPPNTGRPSGGVVFTHKKKLWKYTNIPGAVSFYGGYEPVTLVGVGPHLFDLGG
eukprot:CAMPEP_0185040918 /NCGR_PEP_ID=MMETSP1103-20130426/39579_1 /TAXON_ID=36769 /ORGANISM="Paraphysomonas bandaiensis, Strain Caron Lab Isolate" /LENGTH=176 /DNA_ID=CAMNT_0027580437 /DNA_START=618 /DNA_END=1147 /DNA_ORIENTATION=-